MFQWSKYMANRAYSWFTGWIYLFAGILTVTSVVATLPLALIPALEGLGWHSLQLTLHTELVVALITLVVITVLNIYGVRLVAIINNTGVLFEILGMFVFAIVLLAFHDHQGFHVITNSGGLHVGANTFLAAMFMCLFVIYGFDTASTLAEETRDPRRAAPRAVLFSIIGAFIIGGVFLLATLMAIPNLHTAISSAWGPQNIIEANFSHRVRHHLPAGGIRGDLRLLPVDHGGHDPAGLRHGPRQPAAVLQATVAGLALACTRRSGRASRSRSSPQIPFIQFTGAGIIAIAATAMIYFSYFLGNLAILRDRLRGWPRTSSPFRLGKWGLAINLIGLAYGGGDAGQLRLAARGEQSRAEPDRGVRGPAAQLPHRVPGQDSRSCGRCSSSSS